MMKIIETSTSLWNLITLYLGKWQITIHERAVEVRKGFGHQKYDVLDIEEIQFRPGLFWGTLIILRKEDSLQLFGVSQKTKDRLHEFIKEQNLKIFRNHRESINLWVQMAEDFMGSDTYISTSKKKSFMFDWHHRFDAKFFDMMDKFERNTFLNYSDPKLNSLLQRVRSVVFLKSDLDDCIRGRNEEFVKRELKVHRHVFDNVENMPLTQEQRLAAVHFEDVNVLIASAGSGKTSSLVGKAIYAIKKKYFQPQEILVLAFAGEAAEGLKHRFGEALEKQKDINTSPDIRTFHSLGMSIIQAAEGRKPQLAPWANGGDLQKQLLSEMMDEVCQDPNRKYEMMLIVSTLMFGNATGYDQRAYYQDLFTDDSSTAMEMKSNVRENNPSLKTLKGDNVRSVEELLIANWLYLHGIKYCYEKEIPAEISPDGGKAIKVQNPDFYYPEADVYHEHFGLDQNGKAPAFLGHDYLPRVEWKRKFFKDMEAKFFETHSAMFKDGTVFSVLENELRKFGLNPELKMLESETNEFAEAYGAFMNIMITAIKHIRNQGRTSQSLQIAPRDPLVSIFHNFICSILQKYEELLVKERVIDFEEMLIKASVYVENGGYRSPYKFICIDEFQDISQGRRRLIKALLDQQKGSTLFAVGDDWQSIYRFAGADLDIFTRAAKYFGTTKELLLTNTFRSNQGIADAASWFIKKNPIQKKKSVYAYDKSSQGVLEILTYNSDTGQIPAVEKQMQVLADELQAKGENARVFILYRYNYLEPHRIQLREWNRNFQGALEISTMSFHGSKGLEADYVFILGMNGGRMGFPSVKHDHPLLQMYMAEAEPFPYAEERRLFYVALTRAKRKVFFVARKGLSSIFLQELLEMPNAKAYFKA